MSGAEPAIGERQRVQALQLVFTTVMEDVISALSGCVHVLAARLNAAVSWQLQSIHSDLVLGGC